MGSNKGMLQNRHGVYRKNTGAWSPDYTGVNNVNNVYTHYKNTACPACYTTPSPSS